LSRAATSKVPDHYRQHVADKLRKVERYDEKIMSVDVELFHERNRRQSDNCQRVEITCSHGDPSSGPRPQRATSTAHSTAPSPNSTAASGARRPTVGASTAVATHPYR
jgi:hypothetical protein